MLTFPWLRRLYLTAGSLVAPPPPPDTQLAPGHFPAPALSACSSASHLFLLELLRFFLIFRLKKQQHLVSSTTSTSSPPPPGPTLMGALERSAVPAPSSAPLRSMLVEPRTTWTDGCRFSLVSRGPRPSMPDGLDSDHAPFWPATPPPSLPVLWRSRAVGEMTS